MVSVVGAQNSRCNIIVTVATNVADNRERLGDNEGRTFKSRSPVFGMTCYFKTLGHLSRLLSNTMIFTCPSTSVSILSSYTPSSLRALQQDTPEMVHSFCSLPPPCDALASILESRQTTRFLSFPAGRFFVCALISTGWSVDFRYFAGLCSL